MPCLNLNNPKVRKTWSRAQTHAVWSTAEGKLCPTDNFIEQIGKVYKRAQKWRIYFAHQPPPA